MKWPLASLFRADAARPFNLTRWFAIVGLVSIVTVGVGSALLLSNLLTNSMLQQEGSMSAKFLQSLVSMERSLPEFIRGEPIRDAKELKAALRHIAGLPDATRANLYNLDHALIWSTDEQIIGRKFEGNPELEEALNSGILVVNGDIEEDEAMPHKAEHVNLDERGNYFVEVYVPVRDATRGKVIGVIELYKSPKALEEAIRIGRLSIFIGAAGAGVFLYLALFGLARRADALIRTQREQLVQSEILAAVGEMSSAVAHGIRNPLAAIRSSAELALDGKPEHARETRRTSSTRPTGSRHGYAICSAIRVRSRAPTKRSHCLRSSTTTWSTSHGRWRSARSPAAARSRAICRRPRATRFCWGRCCTP